MNDHVDSVCRALAHPLRRRLLRGLTTGECDVGVMQGKVEADQPTVSKHLAVLREAGLVEVRVDGRRRCYSLAHPEGVRELFRILEALAPAEEEKAAQEEEKTGEEEGE